MKKLLLMALLLTMTVVSASAFAEGEITLPAGLEFGMDFAEATAVSHYTPKNAQDYAKMEAYISGKGFSVYDYLQGEATIGGMDADVYVFFDEAGLKQIEYQLYDKKLSDGEPERAEAKESFDAVEIGLTAVYGDPVSEEQGTHQYTQPELFHCDYDSSPLRFLHSIFKSDGHTARIATLSTGCSVYIDNLCGMDQLLCMNENYQVVDFQSRTGMYNRLIYTYYDFQVDTTSNSTSVGF